ncbi:MAG: ribosome maturation factor RimM [Oscillospiraceae bacterium]|jgi:16S rRNA processing protein RimM|nr:ribosome maturation factor RimM [Oscillospiraceae bacterium]
MKQYLEIGKIVSVFGIKGEVKVEPWCDTPEFFCKFKKLYQTPNGGEALSIKSRPHKNMALCKIDNINTPEQAHVFVGKILYINRDDAKLQKGEYFVQDLIGLLVLDSQTGQTYGTIADVLKTGANDVYAVKTDENAGVKDFLVPVIPQIVVEKNAEEGYVKICPMEGLFE